MTNTPSLVAREQLLTHWVAQQVSAEESVIQLKPIANDAGFRRYFRFATPSHWLAVDAPPQTEDSRQFVALARYLNAQGISTPKIMAVDEKEGLLLVEDFGDELLHHQLTIESADKFYHQTFKTLLKLQACPDDQALIPRYDQVLLQRELLIFSEWFVSELLKYSLNAEEKSLLEEVFSLLETTALNQPQTLVHRDFHSRNLLIRDNENLGVIDFQGALWGACTYDLVSLLRDCYIRWPADKVKTWALSYRHEAIQAGLLASSIDEVQFLRWFDLVGLQRHIKVLGIFARLHLRDNKAHYLQDLPLVIRYTLEVAQNYPELHGFVSWFKERLLPIAQQQSWYSDYQTAGDVA
jgi:aminoglycoside/choline kinase family phosphotransferase